jgi:hypothetical protein
MQMTSASRGADREQHVREAARENAEWCDAVCRSHGVPGEFHADAWTNLRRTPPLYPDAVTLTATASAREVLARIDTSSPGASVKDSFACLDLAPAGFEVLIDAQWVRRAADRPVPRAPQAVRWVAVRTPEMLRVWEAAWAGSSGPSGVFRAELLAEPTMHVLAGHLATRIVAGAVAHRSSDVVGLSNVFAADDDVDSAWAGALDALDRFVPRLPVVGYEHGPALDAALRHGCTPIGPLRIWTPTG